jgi:hypothetical protein
MYAKEIWEWGCDLNSSGLGSGPVVGFDKHGNEC